MDMFKYISEIISHFTAPQRILALLLLLLSIVLITVGPSYIDSITLNKDEYMSEIKKQKELNKIFSNEIDTLNKQLIYNQRKCTNDIIQREREFLEREEIIWYELERLKNEVRQRQNSYVRPIQTEPIVDTLIVGVDTIIRVEETLPVSSPINEDEEIILEGIENIQKHIEDDIQKRKDNN